MTDFSFYVVERCRSISRDTETPHATYLKALLYLVKRSNGYRPDSECCIDVFQIDAQHGRVVVKQYTGQSCPSANDISSAVEHPERFRTFGSGGEVSK